jgi:hypothetical protein
MTDKKPQLSLPKLGLISPPPTDVEGACLQLDSSIDMCLNSIKKMRKTVRFLKAHLDHPFHVEALDNIDSLIDEALIPYLAEVDQEFRVIATT